MRCISVVLVVCASVLVALPTSGALATTTTNGGIVFSRGGRHLHLHRRVGRLGPTALPGVHLDRVPAPVRGGRPRSPRRKRSTLMCRCRCRPGRAPPTRPGLLTATGSSSASRATGRPTSAGCDRTAVHSHKSRPSPASTSSLPSGRGTLERSRGRARSAPTRMSSMVASRGPRPCRRRLSGRYGVPSPDPPPLATLQRAGDDLGSDVCQVLYRPWPGSSVGRARG